MTWRFPRFSALDMFFKQSASTEIFTTVNVQHNNDNGVNIHIRNDIMAQRHHGEDLLLVFLLWRQM